ncbi:MAG: tetratricopeptide repeat protein [Saprospiraceae bacterium]|nr:tetratricopeptide repeat protein [Saprospiraceae bacterium]
MDRSQIAFIAGSCALVLLLFFGFDRTPSEQKLVEKSRALSFESADWTAILREDRESLSESELAYIRTLENIVDNTVVDSQRIETLKQLSGAWFERGRYASAGHQAEKVAELEQTESAWAIAGATYAYALSASFDDRVKDACLAKAETCFQNALSLNPDNLEHRINLAICYAEHPPADNPMKGIQTLLRLNEEHPRNTSVMFHLARFGIRTGQYDRAIARLQTALQINPDERRLHCLLATAYRETGRTAEAKTHQELCSKE